MATIRIQGVPLAERKHLVIALTGIYGIGRSTARKICEACNIEPSRKVMDCTEDELQKVGEECGRFTIEGDLRREVQLNIKRLHEIGCYRGKRHRSGLPMRGQRTRTNARTRKGPRKQQQIKK